MATTGKNSKKRVMEITNILGNMFAINMSLQSMDEQVLNNIKRSNIKLDHMIEVNDHLRNQGRSTKAELIMTLPGESKETFITGLNNVLNSNATSVTIYTLMMLHGTQFKNPDYRKQFGYRGKFRIVPLNFGEYDGKKIFDYEEVGIESKDLPFKDYLYLRALALLVEGLHNGRPFNEFFLYAKMFKIEQASLLKILYDNIKSSSPKIQKIMSEFLEETAGELWDSEEELLNHYNIKENYEKLKRGEVGGNLIYKYKSKTLVEAGLDWINFFEKQVYSAITDAHKNIADLNTIKLELSEIANFCRSKIHGLLNPKISSEPIKQEFSFDILRWIDEYNGENRLKDYKFDFSESYSFEYTIDQMKVREDVFKRYGTDINALSKIVTRISNLEGQFRKVRHENDNYLRDIDK